MRFWSKGTVWWLILCIFFIFLVDLFTVKPQVISGNGNLGLVFVLSSIVVFILFTRSLWRVLGELELGSRAWVSLGLGALVLLLLFCYLEYTFALNLLNNLGGTPEIKSSRIYRYPWLNQYTNTIFVNFYTLCIMVAGITLCKSFKKKK